MSTIDDSQLLYLNLQERWRTDYDVKRFATRQPFRTNKYLE